jgi:hypothetical protein
MSNYIYDLLEEFNFEEKKYVNNSLTFKIGKSKWVSDNSYINFIFYPLQKKQFEEYKFKDKKLINYYKDFLSKHNGLSLFSGTFMFYGITKKLDLMQFSEPISLLDSQITNSTDYLIIGASYYDEKTDGYFIIDFKETKSIYKYCLINGNEVKIIYEWGDIESMFQTIKIHLMNNYDVQGKVKNSSKLEFKDNIVFFK